MNVLSSGEMELKQTFDVNVEHLDEREKGFSTERLKLLHNLIENSGAQLRRKILVRLSTCSSTDESKDFDDLLTQEFVTVYARANATGPLVALLSMRCPDYIETTPLEFLLASYQNENAITILLAAHTAAKNDLSNQRTLQCLRRSLPFLNGNEESFSGACKNWLTANGTKCKLNYDYPYLASRPPDLNRKGQHAESLFILK